MNSEERSNEAAQYAIVNGWLVEVVNGCTCGTGSTSYGHENGCGAEPIARVERLLSDCARLATVERERDEAVTSLAEARGALPNIAQLIQNWSAVERERGQLRVANNRLLARIAAVEAERDRWREAADAMTRVLSTNHSLTYVPTAILDRVSEARDAALAASPTPTPDVRVGYSVRLDRQQWGHVVDGLIGERQAALARKAVNSESTSDLRADEIAAVIESVSAADPLRSASPTPIGPEPARCEHKRTEAHQMLDEFCEWTADCPGPATPEPTEETPTRGCGCRYHNGWHAYCHSSCCIGGCSGDPGTVAWNCTEDCCEPAGPGGADPKETRP